MITYKRIIELIEGKQDYKIYHKSYTAAISEMEKFANKNGFLLDPDELFSTVGTGPKKPSPGKTNSLHLRLYNSVKALEDLKPAKKAIHFQIFGMASRTYELNMYIN